MPLGPSSLQGMCVYVVEKGAVRKTPGDLYVPYWSLSPTHAHTKIHTTLSRTTNKQQQKPGMECEV